MTIRHEMKPGAKLNDDEQAGLKAIFAKQRANAEDLVARLKEERSRQADFVTDTRKLRMVPINEDLARDLPLIPQSERNKATKPKVAIVGATDGEEWYENIGPVAANSHAHQQIGAQLQIPRPYYLRMMEEQPDLLAHNVNAWFEANPARRLVRTMATNGDGGPRMAFARGWMSDKYRRLDALELTDALMPLFNDESSGWQITQCGITDIRVHIEAQFPQMTSEIVVGDPVALAVKVATSDVGAGALAVSLGVYRINCTNLLICPEFSSRQVHIGGHQDELVEILTDRTMRAEDQLTMMKMRDLVTAMANQDRFNLLIDTMKDSAKAELTDPVAATEMLRDNLRLTEVEHHEVQKQLMADTTSPSMWTLTNALTATAREIDYERKAELETAAGRLLNKVGEWTQYQEAVA